MKNKFYKFHLISIKKLFVYGNDVINEGTPYKDLVITRDNFNLAHSSVDEENFYIKKAEDSCHLFKQFKMLYGDKEDIENAFIVLDFEKATLSMYSQFCTIGAIVVIESDGTRTRYVDFLKSSSMAARKKQIYYINEKYKEELSARTTLNIERYCTNAKKEQKVKIPKWYSATGLLLSSCTILDKIKFKSDEIVVVEDKIKNVKCSNVITCVSRRSIRNELNFLEQAISKYNRAKNPAAYQDVLISLNNIVAYSHSCDAFKINDDALIQIFGEFYKATIDDLDYVLTSITKSKEYLRRKSDENEVEKTIDWHTISVKDYYVESNLFDGEGLVSLECAEEINNELNELRDNDINLIFEEDNGEIDRSKKKKKSGSFQIRLPFTKGVIHSADLKYFFEKNEIKTIRGKSYIDINNSEYLEKHGLTKDIKNSYKEYDVSKIKVILTESQVKFLSDDNLTKLFFDSDKTPIEAFFDKLYELNYGLGINNVDPKNDGEIKMNHEFWSTLPLPSKESEKYKRIKETVLASTEKSIKKLSNPQALISKLKESTESSDFYSIDYEYALADQDFYFNSKKGKNFIQKYYDTFIDDVILGKVKIKGERRFLSSDLLYLLYKISNMEMPEKYVLSPNEFYVNYDWTNSKEKDSLTYIFLRTPHYARNEITFLKQKMNDEERRRVFPTLKSVAMVNATSLVPERLAGADYDGDSCFIITDYSFNQTVIPNLKRGSEVRYPLVKIPSIKRDGTSFNIKEKIKSWKYGFDSKIGVISNNAFTQSFEVYKKDSEYDNNEMAFYTLISGLDIDAKKTGYLPSKYFANIIVNPFAKNFIEKKKKPRTISTIYADEMDNILVDFIDNYKNSSAPSVIINEKYKSKYPLSDVNDSTNKEDISRALIKYYAYNGFQMYREYIHEKLVLINKIEDLLMPICEKHGIAVNDLIETFKVPQPAEAIESYRNKKLSIPFHFMVDEKDKINFLQSFNFLNNELKEYLYSYNDTFVTDEMATAIIKKAVETVLDFSDDGYKTFYHILQYQRFVQIRDFKNAKDVEAFIGLGANKNVYNKAKACHFTKEEIDTLMIGCKEFLSKTIIDFKLATSKQRDAFEIKYYLDIMCSNIPIEAIKAISKNIQEDETICTIFSKEIISYLKEGNQDGQI